MMQTIPGISTGILVSFLIAESMVGVPAEKNSTALGFFQATYAIGMTGLPVVMGALVDAFSMFAGYVMLAAASVAAAVVAVICYAKAENAQEK